MGTYVITEPCIDVKDGSCVEVCPVACIHTVPQARQYFIDPEVCIACEQCVIVCPVDAIFLDTDVPEPWRGFIERNAEFFRETKPPVEPVSGDEAKTMIAAIERYAHVNTLSLAIAIVDPNGEVVADRAMDQADVVALESALGSARKSAASGARCEGGQPIVDGLDVIGALGVGGAAPEDNNLAARAGVAARAVR